MTDRSRDRWSRVVVEQALEDSKADLIAFDASDRPVLVAEVRRGGYAEELALDQLARYVAAAGPTVAFAMLADPTRIRLYRVRDGELGDKVAELESGPTLNPYLVSGLGPQTGEVYLTALVRAWLRDLAYNWNSDDPPGREQLLGLGLAPLLRGGSAYSALATAAP